MRQPRWILDSSVHEPNRPSDLFPHQPLSLSPPLLPILSSPDSLSLKSLCISASTPPPWTRELRRQARHHSISVASSSTGCRKLRDPCDLPRFRFGEIQPRPPPPVVPPTAAPTPPLELTGDPQRSLPLVNGFRRAWRPARGSYQSPAARDVSRRCSASLLLTTPGQGQQPRHGDALRHVTVEAADRDYDVFLHQVAARFLQLPVSLFVTLQSW